MNTRQRAEDVDGYIATFPEDMQVRLGQIRNLVHTLAPDAVESISYAIPAYKVSGKPLIYFAGYAKHIGVYPLPDKPSNDLAAEMAPYVAGKGTLQFANRDPLPLDLIERVVRSRLESLKPNDSSGKNA